MVVPERRRASLPVGSAEPVRSRSVAKAEPEMHRNGAEEGPKRHQKLQKGAVMTEERIDRPDQRVVPWEEMSFSQRLEAVLNERVQAFYDFGALFLPKSSPEMVAVANRAEESIRAQYPEMSVYHDVEGERREFGVRFDAASWGYVSAPSDGAVVQVDPETREEHVVSGDSSLVPHRPFGARDLDSGLSDPLT